MVNVTRKRCSHETCEYIASFNVEGSKTGKYCKQHADDSMININIRHCAHATCSVQPFFNIKGSMVGVYCRKHAEDGMVDVRNKRCSHYLCKKEPSWGALAGGLGTTCDDHKSSIVNGPIINFRALCKSPGCELFSTWGLSGKQPSHCRDHGPLHDALSLTVKPHDFNDLRYAPDRILGLSSFHVKAECQF